MRPPPNLDVALSRHRGLEATWPPDDLAPGRPGPRTTGFPDDLAPGRPGSRTTWPPDDRVPGRPGLSALPWASGYLAAVATPGVVDEIDGEPGPGTLQERRAEVEAGWGEAAAGAMPEAAGAAGAMPEAAGAAGAMPEAAGAAGAMAAGAKGRVGPVATLFRPFVEQLLGPRLPVTFRFWDGSALSASEPRVLGAVVFRSPNALRRVLWRPGELGLARAWVEGDIDVEGDLFQILCSLEDSLGGTTKAWGRSAGGLARDTRLGLAATHLAPPAARLVAAAARLGALWPPPPRPDEEAPAFRWRLGWRHSPARDAAAIRHHYDLGEDFYRLFLGPSMTYSCARFEPGVSSLEQAQRSKHELICRKLGLHERPGMRLLDVGCGWGSLVLHAAKEHGARAVGITLSRPQAEAAKRRAEAEGLGDAVEIRLQDYRDLRGETFDAISSVGMFEHVGAKRMGSYFKGLASLLSPRGRLLNHAISKPGSSRMDGPTFINRYVFPDGELIDVADVVREMERAGLEVRDVESLREHYGKTLRAWVANLESHWQDAVRLVGSPRTRIWRLYMAASAVRFERNRLAVHQVLGVKTGTGGDSGMPPTRAAWG
jgi:cyclopropane-fatty-acyl-phospholipid synthase